MIFDVHATDRVREHASCVVFCSCSNEVLWLQLIHKTVSTPRNRSTLESSLLVHRISGIWKLDGPMIFDNRSGEGTCKLCFVLLLNISNKTKHNLHVPSPDLLSKIVGPSSFQKPEILWTNKLLSRVDLFLGVRTVL